MFNSLSFVVMSDNELRKKFTMLKEQFKIAKENHEYEQANMILEEIRSIKGELSQR